jgi:flagellin
MEDNFTVMDFSFVTNLNALAASYYLNQTNSAIQQSLLRLSSGLRINSPADDPSGFLIATNLQTQVNGMNQALSNIQNDVNEVKTASGAVQQIVTLVQNIQASALDAQSNPSNAAADQQAIQSAIAAINNIANNTTFNGISLLNGTAGTSASVTNSNLIAAASFGGNFANGITQSGNVTITVTQAATMATITGTVSYASANATIANSGTVTINGQSIAVSSGQTVQSLINSINQISSQTGVSAGFSGGKIVLTQTNYGANYSITESDSAGAIIAAGNATTAVGQNALATVTAMTQINGSTVAQTVNFTGGVNPTDSGLLLSDSSGNKILLTASGNSTSTSNVAVANISSNPAQFQIGANVGQTVSFAFQNMQASQLGTTAIPGQSLQSINVTTPTGAANAVQIANAALSQVTTYAAELGNFQKNTLQATQNYLSNAVTNLSASVANIMDVNVAQESVNLANLQLLQQSGINALYTANNLGALYLKLLP